ncbi:unnamed protein product [Lactuca virosa]|uniref:Non-specific lipid-transfer protein n=1 Tax=Lactuca virosa TaxID=75947 RepID=A0AAU9NU98_9ASTR|nr:unnamed protein product [Lactuca virosa]
MARIVMMVLCVVVTCMVVAETYAQAITCDQVVSDLSPCYGYLTNGGAVSSACCSGVEALNSAANSASARQTACSCLKSAYSSNSGINLSNAASLPSECGVNLPYKISPSTDCSTVE